MPDKKSVREVMEYALAVIRAANIRGMEKLPESVPDHCVKSNLFSAEFRRTFRVRAGINLSFVMVDSGMKIAPKVDVSMPAINDSAMSVAASLVLLQEVSAVAVALQVELNEFEIVLK